MRRIAALAAGLLTALLSVVSVFPASASASPAPLAANASASGRGLAMASYQASHWASRLVASVIVAPGDTLSKLAAEYLSGPSGWPAIWWANRAIIPNPDALKPGQSLVIPNGVPVSAALTAKAFRAIPQPKVITISASRSPGGYTYHYAAPAVSDVSYSGGGGFQSCVISRESGGNSQVMNGSGHYGLYQFDYGTWVSGGGAGGDFGHASVSEQNRVFASVYAARGTQPWAPSDGC